MGNEVAVLAGTAATLGVVHTLLGPDHYLPFIVLAKARRWSGAKTGAITALCGVGHVLGSVVLGLVGVAVGMALFRIEAIEQFRGELAAWLLIGFGFAYAVWGLHRAIRRRLHHHVHGHEDDGSHAHGHGHAGSHAHPHLSERSSVTPWVLFIVFVLGPCEPLIPLLMYPAASNDMATVAAVASIYGLTTVATMLLVVLLAYQGLSRLPLQGLERYSHALAGLAVFASGAAIKLLGI